jgi:hypothetical protein
MPIALHGLAPPRAAWRPHRALHLRGYMILVAVGAQPETEIALASGFKGALQVNRRMETNVRDIFAGARPSGGSARLPQ